MTAVKTVWHDDDDFCVELNAEGIGVVYAFPISELAGGVSLSRMMNDRIKETLHHNGWMIDATALRAAAREAVSSLREIIEPYFEARGIGGE
ncbi:hypothetical protein vBRpoSV10_115 [Ruegeria phage vB_RpoS-V10]|nr:hypothetical protein DSS3P8_114 [Roseobacter phage DSS3P8]AWY09237.1 hypothetical protein vBRpoSV10_115 [Ruegeria phage vB_RpoS-V10]